LNDPVAVELARAEEQQRGHHHALPGSRLYELKFDGYRVAASVSDGHTKACLKDTTEICG